MLSQFSVALEYTGLFVARMFMDDDIPWQEYLVRSTEELVIVVDKRAFFSFEDATEYIIAKGGG